MVRYDIGTIHRYGTVRYSYRYGMVRYGTVRYRYSYRYGMVRYDIGTPIDLALSIKDPIIAILVSIKEECYPTLQRSIDFEICSKKTTNAL